MQDLTPEVLDTMLKLDADRALPCSCFSGMCERCKAPHDLGYLMLKHAPALLAAARERDRMRGVLADSASTIADLKHRIAELEQCVLEQSEEFKLIRPPAEIVEQMAVYQQRIAELEAALVQVCTCPVCEGTGKWTPECGACLAGESAYCTCSSLEEETCSCCNGTGKCFENAPLAREALAGKGGQ